MSDEEPKDKPEEKTDSAGCAIGGLAIAVAGVAMIAGAVAGPWWALGSAGVCLILAGTSIAVMAFSDIVGKG